MDQDSKPTVVDTQTQLQDTIVRQWPQGLVGLGTFPLNTLPNFRPPPKPPDVVDKVATPSPILVQNPNLDFEENSPHQEGIITETYVSTDRSYTEEPQEL